MNQLAVEKVRLHDFNLELSKVDMVKRIVHAFMRVHNFRLEAGSTSVDEFDVNSLSTCYVFPSKPEYRYKISLQEDVENDFVRVIFDVSFIF